MPSAPISKHVQNLNKLRQIKPDLLLLHCLTMHDTNIDNIGSIQQSVCAAMAVLDPLCFHAKLIPPLSASFTTVLQYGWCQSLVIFCSISPYSGPWLQKNVMVVLTNYKQCYSYWHIL